MVPYFTRCFLPKVGLGPARSSGKLRFCFGRLVSCASVLPSLLWSWCVSVGLRFSCLLPFQGFLLLFIFLISAAPGQVCWCVCVCVSLSFPFLRSPLVFLVKQLSCHFHFHLTSIFCFHPHLHLIRRDLNFVLALSLPHFGGGVCGDHLKQM